VLVYYTCTASILADKGLEFGAVSGDDHPIFDVAGHPLYVGVARQERGMTAKACSQRVSHAWLSQSIRCHGRVGSKPKRHFR
jgi:hypothetical protein